MANRIRERREALGMSQQALADEIGTSQPQIDRLEKGERKLTQGWLEKLAPALKMPMADLLLPPGVTRGPSPTHRTDRRRKAPDPDQLGLPLTIPIPEINAFAGAGGAGGLAEIMNATPDGDVTIANEDDIRGYWHMPESYLSTELQVDPRRAFVVKVEGDSMSTTLESGDRIVINVQQRQPSPPGLFALFDGIAVVIKRVEYIPNTDPPRLKISSDNPRHESYERTIEEVQIIGRARLRVSRL